MIALSSKEEWDFSLAEERGQEGATVFRLRPLSLRDRNEVEDLIGASMGSKGFAYGSVNTKVLRGGLAGWSGLRDAKGADVRFAIDREGKVRDDLLERLPAAACMEIATEILTHSTMTATDRKN
jgi:hypothetical protein